MKTHEMNLYEGPYSRIKSGIKTVEYRLNDEKRQTVAIGDTITFYKLPEKNESIKTIVTDLKYYDTLLEMYTDTFDLYHKDMYDTPEDVVKATTYYTEEEVKKYGCVAIFFEKEE